MKKYFAYIRVSTAKQGEHGSSLQEQRDAIKNFAARNGLHIANWFEERETAAKVGRHEFTRMMVALKERRASGVIFHKIDRSARNLKDWSAVQELADAGIDVRFTQESINLGSNEGKLTGDFLAVISSHYIRNLREEVKKGLYGRLKQGLYPFTAHIGYLDQGGGKPKVPDPMRAPLVRTAFELYATGTYSLHRLGDELFRRGLRSKYGNKVGANRIAQILRNTFYMGIIRLKRSGATYAGVHEPIISKRLFESVQDVLDGRLNRRAVVHDFIFRRMVMCVHCGYRLIGELQKGHVYYRCHTKHCATRSIREEKVDSSVRASLTPLGLTEDEASEMRERVLSFQEESETHRIEQAQLSNLQLGRVSDRLARLMDIYLDGAVERRLFEEKKLALLMEQKGLEEQRVRIEAGEVTFLNDIQHFLELLQSVISSYEIGSTSEKRRMVKSVTSNLWAGQKEIVVELKSPFRQIANLDFDHTVAPARGRPRTKTDMIFDLLVKHCKAHPEEIQQKEKELLEAA